MTPAHGNPRQPEVAPTYPARLDGRLDSPLSRWLWLVKWFLAIPHYVALFVLWIGVMVASVLAFFAIVFTGRYPRGLFDFTVGVLRWTWRVSYYSYSGLATDRYPPFSLRPDPDYPADFDVEYPERLSRGLVLVKWWLLAIPQYLVVGALAGGGWAAANSSHTGAAYPLWSGGVIGLLVLVAAVTLLVTGRYPTAIYDFVMGLNRWVFRVAAYALLLRDEYPPFRLDSGGADPGSDPLPGPTAGTGGIGATGGASGTPGTSAEHAA